MLSYIFCLLKDYFRKEIECRISLVAKKKQCYARVIKNIVILRAGLFMWQENIYDEKSNFFIKWLLFMLILSLDVKLWKYNDFLLHGFCKRRPNWVKPLKMVSVTKMIKLSCTFLYKI